MMETMRTYRFLFTVADFLILAAAAFVASRILLTFLEPTAPILPAVPGGSVQTAGPERAAPGSEVQVILNRNLFGSRIQEQTAAAGETSEDEMENLPESTLPLELLGTVVQTGGKRSFAIIQNTGTREQDIFFIGDEVQEGVIVSTVTRNRVVLLRGGQEEILEKAEDQTASTPAAAGRPGVSTARLPRPSAQADESITVRKVGDNSYIMDRREVEGILQDFNKLLTQIRVVPHFADGKPDGFKIFNIRPGSLFAQLGMVNGDIIKRVNGLDITGPEQALQMFQQLRDESQVTVDLERFRKNLTVQYEIR